MPQLTRISARITRRYLRALFVQGSAMKLTASDKAIDTIVAACDGDVRRAALEVMFLLEAEMQKLAARLSNADQEHSSP